MDARDVFSTASDAYAAGRPHYPPELFAWIAAQCLEHRAAWDCATGNGQAAIGLAPHFDLVQATDISGEQIGEAFDAANIVYTVQPAERADFDPSSFDLVVAAQALHWFDYERFWPEVRRVAKPGAFFCAWGYAWTEGPRELHEVLFDPLLALLEPYWAANNGILWRGYRSDEICFPFDRLEAPAFAIELDWTIDELLGYVRTWSAWRRSRADEKVAALTSRLEVEALRSFAGRRMLLKMPLALAAGRIA